MTSTYSIDPTHPGILVFDSGVGGLSVAAEIQKKLPFLPIIYASDNAFFPYGTKGEAELIERVDKVLRKILSLHKIDLIVIACNTASTLTLPHCRQHFTQPIVGVVPAIKPAAQLTRTGVIGLLATPATVARPYTHKLIEEHAPECRVISIGSSELVTLAEKKLRGEELDTKQIDSIIAAFFTQPDAEKMDTMVLACTHFPLIRDEILASVHRVSPLKDAQSLLLIDSGEAIARRVESLLQNTTDGLIYSAKQLNHLAIFTKDVEDVADLKPALVKFDFTAVEFIDVT
jgi:glutamate racemase